METWLKVHAATRVKYELIFSDDGSDDDTLQILESYAGQLPIQILRNQHGGPAEARNKGIAAARGRRILFLGDDIYPGTELLNLHVALGDQLGDLVAIQGRVDWHPDQKQNHLIKHITEIGNEQFCFEKLPENGFTDYSHFYTCNVSVSSHLLSQESIKFDTRFYKANFEDIELSYRLSAHGMQVYYAPAAHALHFHEYDVEGFSNRQKTAGEMAFVFSQLHNEWDHWLGVSSFINQYHEYLERNGIRDQPHRQLPLVFSSCKRFEKRLHRKPGDQRLQKILSLIYLQLFKLKFATGLLGQAEDYDESSVDHFLYDRYFGREYYNQLTTLIVDELAEDISDQGSQNLLKLCQYYLHLFNLKWHWDDIQVANSLISDSLPADMHSWMVRPGLKKMAKSKTRDYLKQVRLLRKLRRKVHRMSGKIVEQEQVNDLGQTVAAAPEDRLLPRVAILCTTPLPEAVIQACQKELGTAILFISKTDSGFEYQQEGATGFTTDLSTVDFAYILQIEDESEFPQIFQLKNVLVCLACYYDDYVLISYSYQQEPAVGVKSLAAQLFLKRDLFFAEEHVEVSQGRIMHLLPAPAGTQSATLTELLATNAPQRDYLNQCLQFEVGQFSSSAASRIQLDKFSTPADKPVIFVFPMVMAVGGAERNIIAVMQELQEKYHFVVITMDRHTERQGSLHHQVQKFTSDMYDLAEIASTDDYLGVLQAFKEKFNPQLLLITNGSPWFLSHSQQIRTLFEDVPIIDHQVYDQQAGWIQHYTDPGIQSFDRFVAINQKIETVMQSEKGISQERIRQIYHAVDTARIRDFNRTHSDPAEICQRYGLPLEADKYIYIARMTFQKRPLAFLEMLKSLQDSGRSEFFIMIGDGDLKHEVDNFVSTHQLKNLVQIPFVNNPLELISVSRGMVFTSLFEGLPVAMLEALTLGVPVFSTDVGDVKVVLDEYAAGFTFPVECSAREMVWYFHQFLAQREEYATHLSQVKDQIIDRFSAETVSSQYDDLFQDSIHLKRGA